MPKRVRNSARVNWSHENKGAVVTFSSTVSNGLYQGSAVIVPSSTDQGTRTAGNFSITVPVAGNGGEYFWALVYVPANTTTYNLFATAGSPNGSLYEPNQFVIASGLSDSNAGPIRIFSRMKRKLHSGDNIQLVIGSTSSPGQELNGRALVSYSIKYN